MVAETRNAQNGAQVVRERLANGQDATGGVVAALGAREALHAQWTFVQTHDECCRGTFGVVERV